MFWFIEIKGDHFFENGVLVNPYNRNSFTDGKYLAKYNCMKNNNVIILTGKDLRNMEIIWKKLKLKMENF